MQQQQQQQQQRRGGRTLPARVRGPQVYWRAERRLHAHHLGLVHEGFSASDTVGLCLPNCARWAATDMACLRLRCVSIPLPTGTPADVVRHIIDTSGMTALFVDRKRFKAFASILVGSTVRLVVLCSADSDAEAPVCTSGVRTVSFEEFCETWMGVDLAAVPLVRGSRDDTITVFFTSGSTGFPKGAVISEQIWLDHVRYPLQLRLVVLLGYLPLSHAAGRLDLYTALFNGGRIVFPATTGCVTATSSFAESNPILRASAAVRPTAFGPVPQLCDDVYALFQEAVSAEVSKGIDRREAKEHARKRRRHVFGDRLCSVKVSSAPIRPELLHFFRKLLKVPVSEGYGSTEAGGITQNGQLLIPIALESIPSLGYLTTDHPPSGEILVPVAEIHCHRYLTSSRSGVSGDANPFDGGWFRTGDIGEWDDAQCTLHVVDRRGSVVKLSGGLFVCPEHAEQVLRGIEGVRQAFVYADSFKARAVALIAPTRHCCGATQLCRRIAEELPRLVEQQQLCPAEMPCAVHVMDEDDLPDGWNEENGCATALGKLCRRAITARHHHLIDALYIADEARRLMTAGKGSELVLHNASEVASMTFVELGGDSFAAAKLRLRLSAQ
eukprot:TRINITY_DN2145_c0_g1_i1.p1 TRINITY_DN2145_c0_g1~~TRINITY_DN2145_c0_g1_i1.p1  ORF type:complete len:626 (-),score=109.94 TRINITY_DN2145_c0_g1_i1:54-1886(-)